MSALSTARFPSPAIEEALTLLKKKEAICLELGDRAGLKVSYRNQAVILQDWGNIEPGPTPQFTGDAEATKLITRPVYRKPYGV